MNEIYIRDDFKELIPPLTDDEYRRLEESLVDEGCRDALCVWKEYIDQTADGEIETVPYKIWLVDGHNRYEICREHNIPFETVYIDCSTSDDVKLWMMKNQLARRNLNSFQYAEIVHKCEGPIRAKARERQATSTGGANPQLRENFPEAVLGRANDELGAMAGMSGKTYEHAVAVMESGDEELKSACRRGDLSINRAYEIVRRGGSLDEHKPHVANNSGNNEWYTPSEYIEAAREAMGSIDLDPATSEYANRTVKATTYYTAETNGLDKPWHGNVWLNPPYSSDLVGRFIDKLVSERGNYQQAIVLVNNATETEWFSKLVLHASAVCFTRGRVRYYTKDGTKNSPLQGQALVYIGDNPERFVMAFDGLGWGCYPAWNIPT